MSVQHELSQIARELELLRKDAANAERRGCLVGMLVGALFVFLVMPA